MLVLAGPPPDSAKSLAAALERAVAEVVQLTGIPPAQVVGEFPSLQSMRVDISGATMRELDAPPAQSAATVILQSLTIASAEFRAMPLRYQGAAIALHVTASVVRLNISRDAAGKSGLDVVGVRDGTASLQTTRADLEKVIFAVGSVLAEQQKAKLEKVQLALTSTGERSARFDLRATARKMMFPATLRLQGELRIDDAMNARITGLQCDGEGTIGNLVANAIRPKLRQAEGRAISLMAIPIGNAKIRELKFIAGEQVKVDAVFGS